MKLIYIANIRVPTEKAHGIQIFKMCEAFAAQKIGVRLFVPTRRNPDFLATDPFAYFGAKRNFEMKEIKTFDPWWLLKLPQGMYIKAQSLFFLTKLYFSLKKSGLDGSEVFYTREEYLLPLLERFSSKVIWEAHNLPQRRDHYLKYWKKCMRIAAISKGLKKDLVSLGVDEKKVIVAPDGVDVKKFQVPYNKLQTREELGLPSEGKIVMYTGHLYEWKGAHLLLNAARNAKFLIPDSKYIFVGGTKDDIEKFKERAKGLDNVVIAGHKPPNEIPKYLAAADVLVLPNSAKSEISSKYTSPLKLFEYMAAGKPIVASYLPSLREILDDTTALFFTPDDPEDLARKIEQVLEDQELYTRLSQNALEKAKEHTWHNRAQKIVGSLNASNAV